MTADALPPLAPGLLRVVAELRGTAEWLAGLSPGDRLVARVLDVSPSGVWLAVAGRRLRAESRVPLEVGRSIDVEVARHGVQTLFRVIGPDTPSRDRPVAGLDRLLAASDRAAPADARDSRAGVDLGATLERMREAGWRALPRADLDCLVSLLERLPAGRSADALADCLRQRLERAGWLFEAHLRASLAGQPGSEARALAGLADDLRVLLGRLARAAVPSGRRARQAAGTAGLAAESLAPADLEGLVDRVAGEVLRRQVEEAVRWIRDGAVVLDLPFAAGHETSLARLIVRRDRQGGGQAAPDGLPRVEVRLDTRLLGRVEAQASWSGQTFHACITVERAATRDLFEAHCAELVGRLGDAGFTQASIVVRCDPARLAQPGPLPGEQPPPGGWLVDVRV